MNIDPGLGTLGRTVALSPHLDDAVLSVGGYLSRRVTDGASVTVASVYTAGADPKCLPRKFRVFGDYSTRIREDDRALALIGTEADRLGFSERLFREPGLARVTQVFRTPSDVSGFEQIESVTAVIEGILTDPNVELLAPLGIGNHVDHVEVALATLMAVDRCGAFERVWFYEDFYALSELARRRHPVSASQHVALRHWPLWASPIAGLRTECISLFARGPASSVLFAPHLTWSSARSPVGGHEDVKLAAVAEYRTQARELGGLPQLLSLLRRAHSGRGGEIMWSARPCW